MTYQCHVHCSDVVAVNMIANGSSSPLPPSPSHPKPRRLNVETLFPLLFSSPAAIDYIVFLQSQAVRQQQQLEALQREVKALGIMKE